MPTSTYALSKVASETIAGHIAEWSGIPFIALRFSNILGPADYQHFPAYWKDPQLRKWNLWGYIDERDAAAACRLSLDADLSGSDEFHHRCGGYRYDPAIGRPDARSLPRCGADQGGPGERHVAVHRPGPAGPGFVPRHTWRDHVTADQAS